MDGWGRDVSRSLDDENRRCCIPPNEARVRKKRHESGKRKARVRKKKRHESGKRKARVRKKERHESGKRKARVRKKKGTSQEKQKARVRKKTTSQEKDRESGKTEGTSQEKSPRVRKKPASQEETGARTRKKPKNPWDAPRASAATRRKQREGQRFQTEFIGRSTRQRCRTAKTARGASIPSRSLGTLHAPALPRGENSERFANTKQNSQDAPRANAATCPKQREGQRFQTEFIGRSTRQRCHAPKKARGAWIPGADIMKKL